MSERLTFADPRGDTKQRPVRHVLGRGVVQEPGQNPDVRRRRDSADALRLRTSLHPNTRTAADARRVARMDFPQQKLITRRGRRPELVRGLGLNPPRRKASVGWLWRY